MWFLLKYFHFCPVELKEPGAELGARDSVGGWNSSVAQQHNVNICERTGEQGAVNRKELRKSSEQHQMCLQLPHAMTEDKGAVVLGRVT